MAPTSSSETTLTVRDEFARFCGEFVENIGFNKSVGQIYGYLYLSPETLSLDEIARGLSMSKGNASINLRFLEAWGAVLPVWINGSRRDHYRANRDIKEIVLRRLQEGLSKRLDMAEKRLGALSAPQEPALKKQLQDVRALVGKGRKALRILPKILSFLG